jgi:hypothetical protein
MNHRYTGSNKVTSHEGESRDTVTIIFYITGITLQEFSKAVRSSNLEKLLQTVRVMVFSSGKTYAMITARRQDGCHAKPKHDITRYHQYWSGMDPIPRTNLLEKHRAKAREE